MSSVKQIQVNLLPGGNMDGYLNSLALGTIYKILDDK